MVNAFILIGTLMVCNSFYRLARRTNLNAFRWIWLGGSSFLLPALVAGRFLTPWLFHQGYGALGWTVRYIYALPLILGGAVSILVYWLLYKTTTQEVRPDDDDILDSDLPTT